MSLGLLDAADVLSTIWVNKAKVTIWIIIFPFSFLITAVWKNSAAIAMPFAVLIQLAIVHNTVRLSQTAILQGISSVIWTLEINVVALVSFHSL